MSPDGPRLTVDYENLNYDCKSGAKIQYFPPNPSHSRNYSISFQYFSLIFDLKFFPQKIFFSNFFLKSRTATNFWRKFFYSEIFLKTFSQNYFSKNCFDEARKIWIFLKKIYQFLCLISNRNIGWINYKTKFLWRRFALMGFQTGTLYFGIALWFAGAIELASVWKP